MSCTVFIACPQHRIVGNLMGHTLHGPTQVLPQHPVVSATLLCLYISECIGGMPPLPSGLLISATPRHQHQCLHTTLLKAARWRGEPVDGYACHSRNYRHIEPVVHRHNDSSAAQPSVPPRNFLSGHIGVCCDSRVVFGKASGLTTSTPVCQTNKMALTEPVDGCQPSVGIRGN